MTQKSKVVISTESKPRLAGLDTIFKQRKMRSQRRGLFYRAVPAAAPRYAGKDLQRIEKVDGVTRVHLATPATLAQKEYTKTLPRLEPVLDMSAEAIAMAVAAVLLVIAPTILHLQWTLSWGGLTLLTLLAIVSITGLNLLRKDRTEKELKVIRELIASHNFEALQATFDQVAQRPDGRFRDFLTIATYSDLIAKALEDGDLSDEEVRLIATVRDLVNDAERKYIHRFHYSSLMGLFTRDEVIDDKEAHLLTEFLSLVDLNEHEVKELRQLEDYYTALRKYSAAPLVLDDAPAPLAGKCYLAIKGRLLKYEPVREFQVAGQQHVEISYQTVSEGLLVVFPDKLVFHGGSSGSDVQIPLATIEQVNLLPADDVFEITLTGFDHAIYMSTAENSKVVTTVDKAIAVAGTSAGTASNG